MPFKGINKQTKDVSTWHTLIPYWAIKKSRSTRFSIRWRAFFDLSPWWWVMIGRRGSYREVESKRERQRHRDAERHMTEYKPQAQSWTLLRVDMMNRSNGSQHACHCARSRVYLPSRGQDRECDKQQIDWFSIDKRIKMKARKTNNGEGENSM